MDKRSSLFLGIVVDEEKLFGDLYVVPIAVALVIVAHVALVVAPLVGVPRVRRLVQLQQEG